MPRAKATGTAAGAITTNNEQPPKNKLAARVARAIEDDVIAAGWPVGSVIGSETELIERYKVSRAVFREAVRIVEHHQVAMMRRGRSGGLRVIAPSAQAAVGAAVVYLESTGTTVDDLLHVRSLLEPLAAAEAAKHASEAEIQKLRDATEHETEVPDDALVPAAYGDLHIMLAQVSGNPVLQLFVEVLSQLTDRYAKVRRVTKADRAASVRAVDRTHRAIVDAVVAGDAATAEHYMSLHLEALHQWFVDTKRRIVTRRPIGVTDRTANGPKLAEIIAEEIRADIVRGRWQVGEVIDSENGLVERYDVSRAAIREAVRLLEHHSIARMRRGAGGGLLVAQPDLDAGVEAMALYLDYRGSNADDLLLVRKALELGCVDIVTGRANDPETRDRLQQALSITPDTPAEDLLLLADELHLAMAELTRNPVLLFLMRTITSLWERHVAGNPNAPVTQETPAEAVARVHSALVEAILAGDRGLARHRMTRHLDAVSSWWY
jgi:DNA-binding FadR family transcriptional regulator